MNLVKRYNSENIDWNIGSLYAHDDYVWKLLKVCKEVDIDTKIRYAFGSIPNILTGGRIPPRDASLEVALDIINKYNELGVGCRLTLSSTNVKEEELQDETVNALLKRLEDNNQKYGQKLNGIILVSDILGEYLQATYPTIERISSQVKPTVEAILGNDDASYYNNLFDLYDIVVVNPFKVQDKAFLDALNHHDRVEFITNHRCIPNCPMAKAHYETQDRLSKALYLENTDSITKEEENLEKINDWCLHTKASHPFAGTSMNSNEINLLINEGFKHFKIEGRDNDGVTFIRDLGDYIFNHDVYSRVAASIMRGAV